MNKNIKIIGNSKRRPRRADRIPLFLTYIAGPSVFLLLIGFIRQQIVRQADWRSSLDSIISAVRGHGQWRLWLVFALMPVNWGIEARKWQLVMRRDGGVGFGTAFKAVLTGATMASFTPNRMGEYLGRILYVREGRRSAAVSLTMVCGIAQLFITLLAGVGGLFYLLPFLKEIAGPDAGRGVAPAVAAVSGLLIFVGLSYFFFPRLAGRLARMPAVRRIAGFIKVLENLRPNMLLRILFLSFVRYIVFIIQYSLVFPVFSVWLGFGQVLGGMSVVFLVMAIVPTFTFLTELGWRWGASIRVLEIFSSNTIGIFAASFAIWLINLVIPALIGSLLIAGIKLFKTR